MIKTFKFVPVIDGLVDEFGSLHAAYVYGYLWVHKSSGSKFDEPLERVAKNGRIGRSTVFKWVGWLCENGYLQDLTPELEGQAHTYLVTDKVSLEVGITFSHRQRNPSKSGLPPVHQTDGDPSTKRTPRGPRNERHDHDMHDDIHDQIKTGYQALGLGDDYFAALLKKWDGYEDDLLAVIEIWLIADADDLIPDDWGAPLIYKMIKNGEVPPDERPVTFGDEVREAMELHKQLNGE